MTTTAETSAETIDLFSPEVVADPFGWYARLREETGPTTGTLNIGTMMGGPEMWLVTRYEDVRQVLTDPRFLTNPPADSPLEDIRAGVFKRLDFPPDLIPWMANLLNVSDGEDHTRLRKLVSYALTAHRIGKLRPRVEKITADLLDKLAEDGKDGSPVDLVEEYCYPLPVTVICELVGIDEPDRPHWRAWGDSMATMNGERIPTTLVKCIELARELIAKRRAEPQDDLVTALVQAQAEDQNRVSDDEIIGILFSLVTAGHQTTTYLIGNSVILLLENPDQLARLKENPSMWPQAVRELQRLGPIQFAQPRFPSEDIELGGVTIPRGAPVAPLLLAANTDPRRFPDPNKLIIDRLAVGSEGHLGFGKGIHRCLGQHLAYQEAEVALQGLFTRFPDLSLAVPREEIPWILRPGFTRTRTLPLKLV
ncbi:cytochrome P450 family protein [Salinispora arenicola]|uniref:Cytochrome P450 n=2 Tax=Salinispora arenicola TaxID=168697 RepID=A0A542XVE5_SALAC|nr:cytochrome P450 [Salinispora arenicola]MCN0153448.1 cytochrome P450 [Salinispora arenicola]MCN0179051.1 cytochrome P450 [Salinispora arenicola]NIL41378.1 cytochrome P450 [Salinispora arenicola]NIL56190.1 cytochrome P450 [Salinispora arenicola]NIL62182.1 cytochrome P450 [Salinispora arenicola]